MKKIFKLIMIVLMLLGITLSVLNFISIDNMANKSPVEGTVTPDGCPGAGLNC